MSVAVWRAGAFGHSHAIESSSRKGAGDDAAMVLPSPARLPDFVYQVLASRAL
jgi:hypothetical protein